MWVPFGAIRPGRPGTLCDGPPGVPPPSGSWGIMEPMSQTTVLPDTRPQGTDRTGDDDPKMFHYVRKNKVAESAVTGSMVVALCGETFPVTRSPKPGSPVCPACKEIFSKMRPGDDGE